MVLITGLFIHIGELLVLLNSVNTYTRAHIHVMYMYIGTVDNNHARRCGGTLHIHRTLALLCTLRKAQILCTLIMNEVDVLLPIGKNTN